jgi:hypothetical protein
MAAARLWSGKKTLAWYNMYLSTYNIYIRKYTYTLIKNHKYNNNTYNQIYYKNKYRVISTNILFELDDWRRPQTVATWVKASFPWWTVAGSNTSIRHETPS